MTTLVIDTSYLIYRSFFAYPTLVSQDIPTGAFFGFAKTILALVHEYKPDDLVFTNDTPKPTWRHKILLDYKANRPPIQDDMLVQIPLIKDWTKKISKNNFSEEGYEADDYIFTVCKKILKENVLEAEVKVDGDLFNVVNSSTPKNINTESSEKILILSSDRDLYQLLNHPQIYFVQSKALKDGWVLFGKDDFIKKYELMPEQWLDYKALVGDTSDNLKGIPGVGPKTATKILQEVGCLYNLFTVLDIESIGFCNLNIGLDGAKKYIANPKNTPLIEKIKDNFELLKQTYYLGTLQMVPDTDYSHLGYDLNAGSDDFQRFNFKSLLNSVSKIAIESNEPEALF